MATKRKTVAEIVKELPSKLSTEFSKHEWEVYRRTWIAATVYGLKMSDWNATDAKYQAIAEYDEHVEGDEDTYDGSIKQRDDGIRKAREQSKAV